MAVGEANAQEFDCENPQAQMVINHCTGLEYGKADRELNRIWPAARRYAKDLDKNAPSYLPPLEAEQSLLNGQRAWITYRDGHCQVTAASWAGGTGQPMIRNTCLTDLTKKRVKELKEMMAGN